VAGKALIPIVETALGVINATAIAAASPQVATLLVGVADLSAELGVIPTAEGLELLVARSLIVLGCAAARVGRPIDGPYLNVDDEDGLRLSTRHARRVGFGGKAAIHPRQLRAIQQGFAPSPEEVVWARRVLEAFSEAERRGVGAVKLGDGSFVDAPIAERARSILAFDGTARADR
jgi:citrate lyase subunit beta/citryl-CoA lyase